jgi:hypothetical protein
MTWLPIRTAPRDGSCILLVDMTATAPEPDIAHWSAEDHVFRVGRPSTYSGYVYETPTHWQRMPVLPSAQGCSRIQTQPTWWQRLLRWLNGEIK